MLSYYINWNYPNVFLVNFEQIRYINFVSSFENVIIYRINPSGPPLQWFQGCRSLLIPKAAIRDFYKKAVLKNLLIFTGKHLCWSAILLKTDSNTDVFLWILQNAKEHLFWRTFSNDCFSNLFNATSKLWLRIFKHWGIVSSNILSNQTFIVRECLPFYYLVVFNNTLMEKLLLYWKNSLKYKVGCFWRSSFVYTIN